MDDEKDVLEYFERMFLRDFSLELEVYKAGSAAEALACLECVRISVVISDIRMPKISGLELYDRIKERWPDCRVIFLSGFQEFDYVYSSIQKKDIRYLTKLEPEEKIINTVKEVLAEIEESYVQADNRRLIESQLTEALPLLQNKFMGNLLHGVEISPAQAAKRMRELKINLDPEKTFIIAGAIYDTTEEERDSGIQDQNMAAIHYRMEKQMADLFRIQGYLSVHGYVIWILQEKEESLSDWNFVLNGRLEYVRNSMKHVLGSELTFTYFERKAEWSEIPAIYQHIKRTLGYQARLMEGEIILCSEYETSTTILSAGSPKVDSRKQLLRVSELEGWLELGKEKAYFELLDSMTDCLNSITSFHYGPALEIYYRIMGVILKYINEWDLTEKLMFRIELYKLNHLELHNSWKEATDYLKEISRHIFEIHFSDEQARSMTAITRLYHYINANLDQDLSLDRLAEQVNLNTSYLSRLFKSVTQKNIYEYILDCRMRHAIEALLKTNDRIQEIGAGVGYESAQSFTRAFRKYTGKTPTEYREMGY